MLNITNCQGNENQNKVSYHFIPIKLTMIKMTKDNKCWQDDEEKEIVAWCFGGYKLV